MTAVTPDSLLEVHARVSIRPEPFGALLYHFGSRRLSFLKSADLLRVVEHLGGGRTVQHALDEAGTPEAAHPAILRALRTLRETDMLVDVG